jgi:hypothetical protein
MSADAARSPRQQYQETGQVSTPGRTPGSAITIRRGYCSWTVDHAGWVVRLHSPEEHDFYGKTLEEALAWCLVWLMAPELGIGAFLI